ncbi:hypothetical protein PMIN02_005729 [Paraphaeosphaeria minitans]
MLSDEALIWIGIQVQDRMRCCASMSCVMLDTPNDVSSPPSHKWHPPRQGDHNNDRIEGHQHHEAGSSATKLEPLSHHSLRYTLPAHILPIRITSAMPVGQQESGVTSGVKFVTSTVGNTVGGVTNTVGGVVGALGRGVGETLEGATGSAGRPVARGIADATTSIENGAGKIAGGVKRAGEGK